MILEPGLVLILITIFSNMLLTKPVNLLKPKDQGSPYILFKFAIVHSLREQYLDPCQGLNLTTSILNGDSRIKMNSLYGGTWWSIEGFDYYRELRFNASILCFKYDEGYCRTKGEINLFNKPCIDTAKQ